MPRTESKATVNNFVGGLVSDYHELNFPPNTTVDEDNVDLDRHGSRKRRLGIDFEPGYSQASTTWSITTWPELYMKTFEWTAVNKDGNLNFLVVQVGNALNFFDLAYDTLSAGEKSFSVNLDSFIAPSYTTTQSYGVQVASGKGALFVVGEAIEPFYILYDPGSDSITTTQLTLKVRDLQLQDHALAYTTEPATVTPAQKYDLFNQGWWATCSCENETSDIWRNYSVFDFYKYKSGNYPQLAKVWWLGKRPSPKFSDLVFNKDQYQQAFTGNGLAALGSYVLNYFNKDRSAVSGVAGLPVEVLDSRPTAVAFGSGRVFYGFENLILFSQVIVDDFAVAQNCFQSNDPTSEKLSDLLATDGGIVQILEASNLMALKSYENGIFAFCTNGVWCIGGSSIGAGFSATDFSIYKVSEAGSLSSRSIISVEGTPCWWSKLGVYMLTSDPAKQGYSVQNLLDKKLQLYYNAIPALSKVYATGAYDRIKKCITFLYNSQPSIIGNNPYVCDKLLTFDTIFQAFYPWTISVTGTSPLVTDVFSIRDVVATAGTQNVTDNTNTVVIAEDLSNVVTDTSTQGNASNYISSLKFLTFFYP